MNRRKFIKAGMLGAAGVGAAAGLYTWQVEPFWLEFVQRPMAIKHLPQSLEGKTLMQISDIHAGDQFDHQFIIDSFVEAQALNPDLVVYTGDFVDHRQIEILREVMQYAVKGRMGTLGALGNHDYGYNWSEASVANQVTAVLERAGIQVLRNEFRRLHGLTIMGLDDYWGLNFNPKPVVARRSADGANIVLCHNPDVCDLDIWEDYEGWILSGHTHGGQCKPPFLPPPILPVKNTRYAAGEVPLQPGRKLYVNRALGHLIQVRFNVRPEITVFTLQRA